MDEKLDEEGGNEVGQFGRCGVGWSGQEWKEMEMRVGREEGWRVGGVQVTQSRSEKMWLLRYDVWH